MSLGWTSSESLLVIMEDGSMSAYSIHGQQIYTRTITRVSEGGGGEGGGRERERGRKEEGREEGRREGRDIFRIFMDTSISISLFFFRR